MKVLILNDWDLKSYIGGAALVNDKIMSELSMKGHETTLCLFNDKNDTNMSIEEITNYDFYILANIAYVPTPILEQIINNKKFITFRHDIPTVIYSQPKSIFHKEFKDLWRKMFDKAEMTYFISPMQQDVFEAYFEEISSTVCVPPLDVSSFKNEANIKREGCLYLGDISHARGCVKTLKIMKQSEPNSRYKFVGKILDIELSDWLKNNGAIVEDAVEHKLVPKIMNEYKNLYYFPEIYDSFCLKILEAQLCGMKVIADTERIGIFSYNTSHNTLIYNMEHITINSIISHITL